MSLTVTQYFSGGWASGSCPHMVVYCLKFVLRGESPRDYADLLRSLRFPPSISISDIPDRLASHVNSTVPLKQKLRARSVHKPVMLWREGSTTSVDSCSATAMHVRFRSNLTKGQTKQPFQGKQKHPCRLLYQCLNVEMAGPASTSRGSYASSTKSSPSVPLATPASIPMRQTTGLPTNGSKKAKVKLVGCERNWQAL